ncbi:MAG: hypothetical protein KBG48_29260 [Kofleriaceae bacterium]|nr:hypothetical protein [Kofleriaceae bacterium]
MIPTGCAVVAAVGDGVTAVGDGVAEVADRVRRPLARAASVAVAVVEAVA